MVNDKLQGRPIKCNKQKLKNKRNKDYAEVVFIGDTHIGSPQFHKEKFLSMLDYCLKHHLYVFLMGDLIEMATRDSVGAGVYEQTSIGQSQYEQLIEWLKPLAKKKLILGSHKGNHEDRVYKSCGVDISKAIARELDVPYLGDACWSEFTVKNEKYDIYSLHGRTGSKFDGTALLALERLSAPFMADLVAMGHTHKCVSSSILSQQIVHGVVKEFKKHLLITGSYLSYGGYASTFGLPPSKLGSPKVKFFSSRHDISISW